MNDFELAKKNFLDGIDYLEKGSFQEAEDRLLESLRLVPNRASTLTNLAATQIKLKKFTDAKIAALKATKLDEKNYEAFLNLGIAENSMHNPIIAIEHFNSAILLHPERADGWLNIGASLNELERYDEALASYEKAIKLNPQYCEAWYNQGLTFNDLQRYDEALASYEKAIKLNPRYCEAWSNKGVTLGEMNCYSDALAAHETAIKLNGSCAEAWSNRGYTLHGFNQLDEALASYEMALDFTPSDINTKFLKSLVHLTVGNFRDGWKDYKNRWGGKKAGAYKYKNIPSLDNIEHIHGKKILVWCEQGYGDTIQFCRFITNLIIAGGDVTLETQPPLKNLLRDSFPSCHVVCEGIDTLSFDFQAPLLDLPYLFDATLETIPSNTPYLIVSNSKYIYWRNRLKKNTRLNIGIAFSGNKAHKNNRNRSMNINYLEPLTKLGNLFLIQKEVGESEKNFLMDHANISFLGNQIQSFEDSAAIAQQMDLIVSVDTSLAHLAGALGLPTYTLLPWAPEWRWLLDRKDSPWYPTMELLRQPSKGDWQSVIDNLTTRIATQYCKCW